MEFEKILDDMSTFLTARICEDIMEKYSLKDAPMNFFGGILFGVLDRYAEAKGIDPEDAITLMECIAEATASTLRGTEEEHENS